MYMMWLFLFLTVVDCGALTDPANGQVSHTAGTTVGQTAAYSCNTGYDLVGDSNRTCQATGMWSGSEPTCQRMLLLPTIKCACVQLIKYLHGIIHICVNRKKHLLCAHGHIQKIYNAVAVMHAHQAYVLLENDTIR